MVNAGVCVCVEGSRCGWSEEEVLWKFEVRWGIMWMLLKFMGCEGLFVRVEKI